MKKIKQFTFQSNLINVSHQDDELVFDLAEVAAAIGYSNPRALKSKILREWNDEVGEYFNDSEGCHGSLRESGVYALMMRVRTPEAKAFRRWVLEVVLPSIAKTGVYEHPSAKQLRADRKLQMELDREARLNKKLELDRAKTLQDMVSGLIGECPDLGKESRRELLLRPMAELGVDVTSHLPRLPAANGEWLSPTDIGKIAGVSSQKVGRTISALGLRGKEGVSFARIMQADHGKGQVTTYMYSADAVKQIVAELGGEA